MKKFGLIGASFVLVSSIVGCSNNEEIKITDALSAIKQLSNLNDFTLDIYNTSLGDKGFIYFTKDYYYDADAIREPHITFTSKSKMKGGRKHFGKVNGTPEKGKNGGNSNLHNGRWDQAFNPKGRNKRTVWSIPLSKFRGAHFAVFPKKLVEIPLKASTKIGDLVLDPFTGSGTTGVVAKEYGRSFIGVELEPEYVKMAQDRIDAAKLTVENTSLF